MGTSRWPCHGLDLTSASTIVTRRVIVRAAAALVAATLVACSGSADPPAGDGAGKASRRTTSSTGVCASSRPPGSFPASFPPIPFPPDAVLVASSGKERPGTLRVDLESPDGVRDNFRFFLRYFRHQRDYEILFTEFDGFDAEISASDDEHVVFITIVLDCRGSVVAIRAAERKR